MEFNIAFGKVVQRYREKHGISQETLAKYGNLHRTAISFYERGQRVPNLDSIFKIAKALGIKPETLVRQTRIEIEANSAE